MIGKVRSVEFLGVYFFGYQLVLGLARPLVFGLTQVLMPTLSHLTDEPRRQAQERYILNAQTQVTCRQPRRQ